MLWSLGLYDIALYKGLGSNVLALCSLVVQIYREDMALVKTALLNRNIMMYC